MGPATTAAAAAPCLLLIHIQELYAGHWFHIGVRHSLKQTDLRGIIGVGLGELQDEMDGGTGQGAFL